MIVSNRIKPLLTKLSCIRNYNVAQCLWQESSKSVHIKNVEPTSTTSQNLEELSSDDVNKRLNSFFDLADNWNKDEVKSGRGWRIEELRIKGNNDLHKLWYILYKERNMLLTMQQAAKDEVENMASPERIDKVEDAMKNIEQVIKERNHAYWKLEVGDDDYVERRKAFRRDIFGRWRWIACSEHLIPYHMNNNWRKMNAPGFGEDVTNFNRKLAEIKLNKHLSKVLKQQFYCRQLLKRFPNLDTEYLQEKFPNVDVEFMKQNLNEYVQQDRVSRFHSIFYHKRQNI